MQCDGEPSGPCVSGQHLRMASFFFFGFVKCFIECKHLEYCKTCIICRFKKEQATLSSLSNVSGLAYMMEINEVS